MEELIRQAFLHIEVIGPHVADGHYDLVGPNGDIILPQVWDTVIEPDWTITMHMWPVPEKPKTPEPQPFPPTEAEAPVAPEPPPAPEAPEEAAAPAAPETSEPAEAPAPPVEEATVVPGEPKKKAESAGIFFLFPPPLQMRSFSAGGRYPQRAIRVDHFGCLAYS